MKFEAVVFDLDGTLLDTLEDIGTAANRVLTAKGFPTHPLERYKQFIGDGVAQLMRRALPAANCEERLVNDCVTEYGQEYARTWNLKTAPYAGIPEMLDALVRSKVKMAVLSNKPDAFTQQCVRELLPHWSFDAVLGATERFPRKPDPASAREVARQMKVAAENCLYAGDSSVDVRTAISAGMFPVGVLWGFRSREELEQAGTKVLVREPGEICTLLRAGLPPAR